MTDPAGLLHRYLIQLELLCTESAEIHKADVVHNMFQVMIHALKNLRQRAEVASKSSYKIAIVGLTNVGKSTLFNALLGEDLAPRRNGPCTAAPIEFVHGDSLHVTLFLKDSFLRRHWNLSGSEALHRLLISLAQDSETIPAGTIERIEVGLPHPLLERNLVLVDTPGFGAAQVGDAAGTHEQALRDYLQTQVSQVFWVVRADQGIGRRELAFYDEWFRDLCEDVLVTGSEDWEPRDRERFRQRFSSEFGLRMPPQFHFVSGLQGMKAQQSGDSESWEAAGIPLLETRIRELSLPEGRTRAIQSQVNHLLHDFSYWLRTYRDSRGRSLPNWWREDSYWRFERFVAESAEALERPDDTLRLLRPQGVIVT